jgi:CheY-like chemotaxis protein/HPt (histidine-containing phosphotransfer) domain-containing protein
MLTSLGQKGDAGRLKAAGFAAYLLKPARQSELLGTLVNVWAARESGPAAELVTRHSVATDHALPQTVHRSWKGTRVLVAEDNIVNQKVATLMLQSLGCRVEVAANGREALRMLNSVPFTMIFMDCEMPEMDGYEATAEIRRRADGKHNLPIIAVTAKATQGDRDYCLQAGMDDYMSKPVNLLDFRAALERWGPGGKEECQRSEEATDAPSPSLEAETIAECDALAATAPAPFKVRALDSEVVQRLRDLSMATDASLLGQIFEAFLSDGEARLLVLRRAGEETDAPSLRKAAHALKGASANVGAHRMAEISQELQALGEAGSVEGAGALIEALQVEFGGVCSEIAAELEKP